MTDAVLSILIPAYNEERTIVDILRRVMAVDLGAIQKEVIVIDNNSTDSTAALARSVPGTQVLTEPKPGKGAALKCGLQAATGNIIIFQDADLEYEPGDFPAMIEPIISGKGEVVLGYRIDARHKEGLWSWLYIYILGWIGNHAITLLTNWLYWNDAVEYEACYKAFTQTAVRSVEVRTDNFDFDNELVCKLLKRGYSTINVPVHYYPRDYAAGKKINWRHGLMILYTIIKCKFLY